MFHLPSRRKGAGLRPVALCAGAFALAFGAQVSWAQSSSFDRNMRVLEAVGTMFEQMGRDAQRNALEEEQRRAYEAQQEEQRRAQDAARHERDEAALLDRARSDPALNPFGAKTVRAATASRSGARTGSAQSGPANPPLLPAASATSPSSRPACTDEAMSPHYKAITDRMPKTQGICDSGHAGKQVFGEMLQLVSHCPDTGDWGLIKQQLREQLRTSEDIIRNTCG